MDFKGIEILAILGWEMWVIALIFITFTQWWVALSEKKSFFTVHCGPFAVMSLKYPDVNNTFRFVLRQICSHSRSYESSEFMRRVFTIFTGVCLSTGGGGAPVLSKVLS